MRLGIVLLGLKLSLDDVLGLGWATVGMVFCVVAATFGGTWWLGRRMGLRGDQPLLIATGYSICGASAIGAVSEVSDSDERDVADLRRTGDAVRHARHRRTAPAPAALGARRRRVRPLGRRERARRGPGRGDRADRRARGPEARRCWSS